jgi:hypothetical protein
MYGIGGERELTEQTLDHLSGYEGARPVRIGNGAWDQRQHDVWGVLLDSVVESSASITKPPPWTELQLAFPTFTEAVSMAAQKICQTLGIGRFPQVWSYLGADD